MTISLTGPINYPIVYLELECRLSLLHIVMFRVVKCLSVVEEAIVDFDIKYIWLAASSTW